MLSIALSMVMYWRLKSSLEIEALMLVSSDFGKDRWKIVRNLAECFFGTRPRGETWKLGRGGLANGPATRPREISFAKLEETMSGWARAVGKFFENLGARTPWKPIWAPHLKLVHSCETKLGSGCADNNDSNLQTSIGVGITVLTTLVSLLWSMAVLAACWMFFSWAFPGPCMEIRRGEWQTAQWKSSATVVDQFLPSLVRDLGQLSDEI